MHIHLRQVVPNCFPKCRLYQFTSLPTPGLHQCMKVLNTSYIPANPGYYSFLLPCNPPPSPTPEFVPHLTAW